MFCQAIAIITPAVVGGIIHSLVIKKDVFPGLRLALDAKLLWRGRRVFGDNKTIRGAAVMILSTSVATLGLSWAAKPGFFPDLPVRAGTLQTLIFGAIIGIGYILGELPNSFFKRQMNIAPGSRPKGQAGLWWYIADQADSVIGVCLAIWFVYRLPWTTIITVLVIGTVVHIVFDQALYALGIKTRTPTPT